jgi:hypothetical protein
VNTPFDVRPTATGDPIEENPFVARRKLRTNMAAVRHPSLREDAA